MITSNHITAIHGMLEQLSTFVGESSGTFAMIAFNDRDSIHFDSPAQIADFIAQLTQLQTRFEAAIAAKTAAPV